MFRRRRKYSGRHVLTENEQRKPLKKKDILLRLKELYEILDLKKGVQLTADDVEIIDYNFALAQLYDHITGGNGGGFAVGFEAESERDYVDEDEDEGETVGGVTFCRGGGLEYVPKARKPRRRKGGRA